MGIIYTYKNVLLLVFVFLIEGELFKGYSAESITMTSNRISDSNVTAQEIRGDIYVHWTTWNYTDKYYIISWDGRSNVTSEKNYTIREHEYNNSSSEIYIEVCPTVDNVTCSAQVNYVTQKIVHPISNLKPEIEYGILKVTWADIKNPINVTYSIFWSGKENSTDEKSWVTNQFIGYSPEVCIIAVIENDSSSQECENAENKDKDTNVEAQEILGDIYVHWNRWDNTDSYYNISWDDMSIVTSIVTSERNYTIRENTYNESSSEIDITVCPTVDNVTCSAPVNEATKIIVHPVSNLQAEIKSGTLTVTWTDEQNSDILITYNISLGNDEVANTNVTSWETDEFNGDSPKVCVTAVLGNDASSKECENAENKDKDDLGLIIGLSVGVPVFVILIAAIVIIKWRPQLCGNRSSGSRRNSMNMDPENNGRDNPQKSEEVLKSEFAMLKDINHKRSSDTAKKYKDKNHYVDVLPYDDTLVNLKKVDYVNASYILDKKFIVTPDPMPDQDNDIWQLIYECDIRVIIRISTEGDQKPMAQYIPDQKGDSWVMGADELQINLMDSQEWDGYTEKTLKLKKNESRDIKHFHLTNWPEGNVQKQQDQAKVLRLISSGRSFAKKNGNKPVLIHCGAGSGRTGTLAGIWHLMDQHDKNEMVNTVQCVKAMREDRVWMVQKEEQYFFMYNCISEYQSNSHIYRASEKEIGQYQ